MAKHIGIVGCSAEGAALCYRTICLEGAAILGEHSHPEVTMHTHSLGEYRKGGPKLWARLMLDSAKKLKKAGADFIVCPTNTIHEAFDEVAKRSPLPWLHIAEEVAREARRRNFRRLGVLGTKSLMESPIYAGKLSVLGIESVIPEAAERLRIDRIIFGELVGGVFKPASRRYFTSAIARLKRRGCDAVVLGCTEIPLIVTQADSALPILDSTRLLARAALQRAG